MSNYEQERFNMVHNQVAVNSVIAEPILKAMLLVPRHNFVADQLKPVAYLDRRLKIYEGREMLKADVIARMLQLCGLRKKDKVLEIACGTGYVTALLCELASKVVAMDEILDLLNQTAFNLNTLKYNNFALRHVPLLMGISELAPFDLIFVNGILPAQHPESLLMQLVKGGKLITVEEVDEIPRVVVYINTGNGVFGRVEHFEAYAAKLYRD
jgi:protein-L-isoaspartate(D-aspartate) O-methyltransferase